MSTPTQDLRAEEGFRTSASAPHPGHPSPSGRGDGGEGPRTSAEEGFRTSASAPHPDHPSPSGRGDGGEGPRAIICFAGNDWWAHNPLPEKHWMRMFGTQGTRVLYVNSIGIGMPGLSSPGVGRRIAAKLASLARWLRRGSENVWVLTPFVLPLWSVPAVRRLNTWLLAAQIRPLLALLGMRRPVFWSGLPTASVLVDRIPHEGSVYYVQDNFVAYYDTMRFTRLADDHARMLAASDAVFTAGVALRDEVAAVHGNVHVIPHGVPASFFRAAADPPPVPDALRGMPHPIIGYWGSLEILQDHALITHLAETHPEWSLVFIGRLRMDVSGFARLPNVHFLGFVPLDEIPAYGVHMDACILSWVQSEWVRFSCPVKLREYLALGKPVVAPVIEESERAFPGLTRTARTHDEFRRALEEELASDSAEKRAARMAPVAGWTWERTEREVRRVLATIPQARG